MANTKGPQLQDTSAMDAHDIAGQNACYGRHVADCTQVCRLIEGIDGKADKEHDNDGFVDSLGKRAATPGIPPREPQRATDL